MTLASIVIPVYNGMPFLPAAIESALSSDYRSLEIVVVDNGSTDGTTEWLRGLSDGRLRVIHRSDTQSAADNWTQAIHESRGAFVKLMCADDLVTARTLSSQVKDLQSFPSAVMAACRRTVIDEQGRRLKANHGLGGLRGIVDGHRAVLSCCLAGTNLLGEPAAVMFMGDAIRAAMPWKDKWPYMIDMTTYSDVLFEGDVICQSDALASFRISSTSWSSALLDQQPVQFRAWRRSLVESGALTLTSSQLLRSEVALRLRTAGRKAYFRRAMRKEVK